LSRGFRALKRKRCVGDGLRLYPAPRHGMTPSIVFFESAISSRILAIQPDQGHRRPTRLFVFGVCGFSKAWEPGKSWIEKMYRVRAPSCAKWVHGSSCTRCPRLAFMEAKANLHGPSSQDREKSLARSGIPSLCGCRRNALERLLSTSSAIGYGDSGGVAGTFLRVCEIATAKSGQARRKCKPIGATISSAGGCPQAATLPPRIRFVKKLSKLCHRSVNQAIGYGLRVTI